MSHPASSAVTSKLAVPPSSSGPAGVEGGVGELEADPHEARLRVGRPEVLPAPHAHRLLDGHVVDHRVEVVVAEAVGEPVGHVRDVLGGPRERRDVAAAEEVERREVGVDVGRLVDRGGERPGFRPVQSLVERLHPGSQALHGRRPRRRRVGGHDLTRGAVPPGVVEDAVVARVDTREDGRVVRQRDGRHAGHGTVAERRSHRHQPGDVGGGARLGQPVERVGVGAVEEEADHVAGTPPHRVDEVGQRLAVLAGEVGAGPGPAVEPRPSPLRQAQEGRDRRGDVHEAARPVDHAEAAHAPAGEDERRTGLDDVERAVLAAVTAPVLVVVGRRVDDAQVGRHRRLEELGHLLVPVRVGVLRLSREPVGGLRLGAGEAVHRLVPERVPALGLEHLVGEAVAVEAAPEPHLPVGRMRLVGTVPGREHHLDHRAEPGIAQDREGGVGRIGPGVTRSGGGGRRDKLHTGKIPFCGCSSCRRRW